MLTPWQSLRLTQHSAVLDLDALDALRAPTPAHIRPIDDITIHVFDARDNTWTVGLAMGYGPIVPPRMVVLGRQVAAPVAVVWEAARVALGGFAWEELTWDAARALFARRVEGA